MEDHEDLPPRYSSLEPIEQADEIWAQSGANVNGTTELNLTNTMIKLTIGR